MFVRVKSAVESDPQHEFDVAVSEFEANRRRYTVVDDEPVAEPRPARYVAPVKPVKPKK